MPSKLKDDRPRLVARHVRSLEQGKKGYKAADAAMDEFLEKLPRCESCGGVVIPEKNFKVQPTKKSAGGRFRLKDKFAEKHMTNVGQNARRFELEKIPDP